MFSSVHFPQSLSATSVAVTHFHIFISSLDQEIWEGQEEARWGRDMIKEKGAG